MPVAAAISRLPSSSSSSLTAMAVPPLSRIAASVSTSPSGLGTRSPAATVWAVDVNRRALRLTATNAGSLGIANVRAARPEDVPETVVFSGIWSNPPVRVGKGALHDLLGTWLGRLAEGASAWLVVNKHLGSDSLATWLSAQGWDVRREASKAGYRVLQVRKAPGTLVVT